MKITQFHDPRWHTDLGLRTKTSRLYFDFKGETVMDNLRNRRSRPEEYLKSLLPEIFKHYNIKPVRAKWSQYAGCKCPCSPGFILYGTHGKNYSVTVEQEIQL
jgi:hypothetical protein